MKPRHQVSRQAIELIKRFEGYRRTSAALPDGGWTIGYGHTQTARQGAEVSESDAEALLMYDLLAVTRAVNEWTFTPLTQNQFDALVCFASNVGLENFRRSTVLRRVNEGAMLQAACAFEMWRKAEFEGERIIIDALVRRRAAEKALFLTPTHGWVPAPSPVVRPRVDYDASAAQPKQRPMNLLVPLDGAEASAHEAPAEPSVSPDDDGLEPSPATVAADAVTARLQALVPDAEPEMTTAEADASLDLPAPPAPSEFYPQAKVEPVLMEAPQTGPDLAEPAEEDIIEVLAELEAEDESETVIEAAPEVQDEAFALTPSPEPEAPSETAEPVAEEPAAVEETSHSLPFDTAAFDAPAERSIPAAVSVQRQTAPDDFRFRPTAMSGMSPGYGLEDAAPMRFTLAPLIGLGVGGLALFGFAVVWASTVPAEGGGSLFVSWIIGLVGIGCVVGAIYLLLARLGGSED